MYRAVAYHWLCHDQDMKVLNPESLAQLTYEQQDQGFYLNHEEVTLAIRSDAVARVVSQVAAYPSVREVLTTWQRKTAALGSWVVDGRDIGTVVFPDAFLKVFLTASVQTRALRRCVQMGLDPAVHGARLEQEISERDLKDQSRAIAPLVPAKDAWLLATDDLNQSQVTSAIRQEAQRRLALAGVSSP
jgi:cytidylate kinase